MNNSLGCGGEGTNIDEYKKNGSVLMWVYYSINHIKAFEWYVVALYA